METLGIKTKIPEIEYKILLSVNFLKMDEYEEAKLLLFLMCLHYQQQQKVVDYTEKLYQFMRDILPSFSQEHKYFYLLHALFLNCSYSFIKSIPLSLANKGCIIEEMKQSLLLFSQLESTRILLSFVKHPVLDILVCTNSIGDFISVFALN